MKKVSVIVPVYNVREYLAKCVMSIRNQTERQIEIILVDDGSVDGSGELCDELAQEDGRIKVIHKVNGGLSSARNRGILEFTCELLCFVDSDDIISPIYVEHLLALIENHECDIAVGRFIQFKEKEPLFDTSLDSQVTILNGKQAIDILFSPLYVNAIIACNKMFRKRLFSVTRFTEGIIHEDEDIMYRLYYASGKVAFSDKAIYGYFSRDNSITKSKFSPRNYDFLALSKKRIAFFQENGEVRFCHLFLKNYCWTLLDFAKKAQEILGDTEKSKKLVQEFRSVSQPLLSSKFIPVQKRLALMLIRIYPKLYFLMVKVYAMRRGK